MMFETFCDWYEGSWNNREQTYTNPREAAYVLASHKRVSENQFHCTYYHHRSKTPYRDLLLNVEHRDNVVLLKNSMTTLPFKLEGGTYVCKTQVKRNGSLYVFEAYLRDKYYGLNDQCFDSEGRMIRGLEDGSLFRFRKT